MKQERQKPKSIKLTTRGAEIELARSWRGWHLVFLIPFAIAWDSFLIFWYATALSQDNTPWIMLVFPVGHLAVGVGLTYFVLCSLVNTTRIRVGGRNLVVESGPIPSPGNLKIASSDLEQLFVVEHRSRKGAVTYELCALLKDGTRVKVLGNVSSYDEALYMEQQIEKHLNIKDRAVEGEHDL